MVALEGLADIYDPVDAMTATQYAKGDAVWVLMRDEREWPARVVIDLGESIVVCSEDDYRSALMSCSPLAGKAFGKDLVRGREK